MSCPDISGLTFSESGIKAIENIRRIQGLGKGPTVLIGSSVFVSIFVGRTGVEGPLGAAWNISQLEWGAWSQAMMSVSPVVSKQIQMIAFDEYNKEFSGKEHEFWKAVMDGCGY